MAKGTIKVDQEECKGCGLCVESCPMKGMELSPELNHYGIHPAFLNSEKCTGCGICYFVCPEPGALTVYKLPVGQTTADLAQHAEVSHAATV